MPQQIFGIFEGFMLEAAVKHGEQARLLPLAAVAEAG
jgi:hypothetical protein